MKRYFVTGIGTDVGKTVVAAILTEALEADYWKPIQAGDLDNTDTMKVKRWVQNTKSVFHPEQHRLTQAMSPHAAAEIDRVSIQLKDVALPHTRNHLIIEGAGGLMVPINDQDLILDLIQSLYMEVIVVSKHYLGSINHTILTIEALKNVGISIKGLIFNGEPNKSTEEIIIKQTGVKVLGHINQHKEITPELIASYASKFSSV